jgi:ElaB/YqjD/DUF883 family membrane-anchored ribosome-binding protein
MGQDAGQSGPPVEGEQRSEEEIREDIQRTREELGETVEALAARTDAKARAQDRVGETRERVTGKKEELVGRAREAMPEPTAAGAQQVVSTVRQNPRPFALVGAFAAGFLIGRGRSR